MSKLACSGVKVDSTTILSTRLLHSYIKLGFMGAVWAGFPEPHVPITWQVSLVPPWLCKLQVLHFNCLRSSIELAVRFTGVKGHEQGHANKF